MRRMARIRGPFLAHFSADMVNPMQPRPTERPGCAPLSLGADQNSAVDQREQFIPLRSADLLELLGRRPEMTAVRRESFGQLAELMAATFHFEFQRRLADLKNAYAPFDPDRDTLQPSQLPAVDRGKQFNELFDRFSELLERANFRRLSEADLHAALSEHSQWGLNLAVNFDLFERLELYSRGEVLGTRSRRSLRTWFRWQEIPVPIFQRLVVMLRLKPSGGQTTHLDTQCVFIKLFKDIPKLDLEMLLPGTQVKMSMFDRAKIIMPTVTGLTITAWKIVKGALLAAAAGVSGVLMIIGLLGGTVGYGARSLVGYLRTKEKYQLSLTKSLYFQNLDNNAGVLCRLLDEAEEQENREALLAYYFLWQVAPVAGWTSDELDLAIEGYLRELIGKNIDFEVGDALEKLVRLQIVERLPNGRLRAVAIADALAAMDHAWDHFFEFDYDQVNRRAA